MLKPIAKNKWLGNQHQESQVSIHNDVKLKWKFRLNYDFISFFLNSVLGKVRYE